MRRAVALAVLAGLAHTVGAQGIDEARARVDRGDLAGAAALLERRLAETPGDAEARFLLARVTAWGGAPARALPMYRDLLAASPDDADLLLGYGQALLWSGDPAAAVPVLERARRLAPDYAAVGTALDQARTAATAAAGTPAPALVGADTRAPSEGRPDPAAASPSGAAGTAPPPARTGRRSLALSARHERLDRGFDPWRSLRLDAAWLPAGRLGGYGAVVAEQRFGLRDAGIEAGALVPLGGGWLLQPEVAVVAGAEFLPRTYADLRLQRDFGGGWVGAASLRHSAYRDIDVQRLALGAERYVGAWRLGYTLHATRLAGDRSLAHDLRLVRSYGEGGEVGLQLGTGREAALIGPQVVASDVRAATLSGRHSLGDWSLLWSLGRVRQGTLYTRQGLGLGLERRF